MFHRIAWMTAVFFAAACGSAQNEPAQVEETSFAAESLPSAESTDGERAAGLPSEKAVSGQIRRADLLSILAKGPGAVLAMVETEPYRVNGQFVGFKIVRFVEGPPPGLDLSEGDVLKAVNGLRIASPDDYYRVFQELRVASEVRFDILRENAALTFTYPVIE